MALPFDFTVRVASAPTGEPRLLGPAVQGPPAGRFVYGCSGVRAGQPTSCWDRRAKVPLDGVTHALIGRQQNAPASRLEVRIAGTGRDGGPTCALVRLGAEAWQFIPASAS